MKIQFNTDNNIEGNERLESYFLTIIEDQLSRYSSHITRIEVHLSEASSKQGSENNMHCVLEARLKNLQPIAIKSAENTLERAVSSALNKLKTTLDRQLKK